MLLASFGTAGTTGSAFDVGCTSKLAQHVKLHFLAQMRSVTEPACNTQTRAKALKRIIETCCSFTVVVSNAHRCICSTQVFNQPTNPTNSRSNHNPQLHLGCIRLCANARERL